MMDAKPPKDKENAAGKSTPPPDEAYPDDETARRRDAALKRLLKTPPRQHKEDVGKDKCREAERSSRLTKSKAGKLTNQRESDA